MRRGESAVTERLTVLTLEICGDVSPTAHRQRIALVSVHARRESIGMERGGSTFRFRVASLKTLSVRTLNGIQSVRSV